MAQQKKAAAKPVAKPIEKKPTASVNSKPSQLHLQKEPLLKRLMPYLIITGVCALVYGQTIWYEFTGLDDSFFLVVYAQYFADFNNFMRGFKESGVLDYYRPLLFGSMIFDYQFTKTDPFFYHVTNVLYHLGACLVIYRMLTKLGYDKMFALITTVIFTAHPLLTQAVAWVPGRNDSMIALMLVGSFNFFLNYIEKRRFFDAIFHWVLFAMALYTKETSAFFPFLCIAFVLIFKSVADHVKPGMVLGVGYALIGLVWFAIRAEALELANKNGTRFTSIIYGDSWIGNSPVLPEQVGKMLIPINQSNFAKFTDLSTFMGLGVIALFTGICIVLKDKIDWRMVGFTMIWFFMFFIPTIIFIFADSGRYDYLEHRIYVPFIAILILWNEWLKSAFGNSEESTKKYVQYGLMALAVVFSATTLTYSNHFKNPENFWKRAIIGAPKSSQVYRGMGKVYYDSGNLKEAEVNFMKAVELNRAEVNTVSDLGKAYENVKDLESAQRCYKKTLEIDSNQVMFITDLARIYEKKGKLDSAEIQYIKAIRRDPNMWQAKFGLGVMAYQKGNIQACEAYWLDVIRINPNYTDTYLNLAVLYFYTQRFEKSIQYLDMLKAKGVDPEKLNPGLVNSLKPYRK
jgi:Flp pilus assembly protein TadD